jgi:hypothetical protein
MGAKASGKKGEPGLQLDNQGLQGREAAWITPSDVLQEGVRVLAQLPLQSCPVADVALQQLLPKILGYLKKTLQDTDGLVREASSEALAAYALGATRLYGCQLPGSTASPVVKVVFDSLAEQKKEAQMGASQALLKVSSRLAQGSMVPVARLSAVPVDMQRPCVS